MWQAVYRACHISKKVYSMKPLITDLIIWAKQAGKILRDGYGKSHTINHKGAIDLVTEMDHKSEAYLLNQIQSRFSDHTIYSEESGLINGIDGACWYIDPLDGTTNYAHHIPLYSVSIAYAEDSELNMGVVYDPMRDECFSAVRGQGAQLNGNPIFVSETKTLLSSLLVTGFPYDSVGVEKNILFFGHFTRKSQGVRRLGSAAIDLCYVAAGRFEGYWEQSLQPYDLAAGALIAREAGAIVTGLTGSHNLFIPPYSILAANPTIYDQMLLEFQPNV